jgi:hypothetical protein
MPTFKFDITDKAINYATETMQKMPGNAGQESLVNSLDIDAEAVITVHIAGDTVDVSSEYDIKIGSSHPDAIEEIISEGEQAFELYAQEAADILDLVREAFNQL